MQWPNTAETAAVKQWFLIYKWLITSHKKAFKRSILSLCLLRFRPTQTKTTKKSKTETKLEFFGFEDKEDQEGEEGSEAGVAGKSSYKIKYFGFDDLSESDSDEESTQAKEKKAKKSAAALAALSSSVDSPHTSDSQDSQASSNMGESSLKRGALTHVRWLWFRSVSTQLNDTFFQQMLLTSLMTPVRGAQRGRRDAQGSKVTSPRTWTLDSKRSSVDPKRFGTMFDSIFCSL